MFTATNVITTILLQLFIIGWLTNNKPTNRSKRGHMIMMWVIMILIAPQMFAIAQGLEHCHFRIFTFRPTDVGLRNMLLPIVVLCPLLVYWVIQNILYPRCHVGKINLTILYFAWVTIVLFNQSNF